MKVDNDLHSDLRLCRTCDSPAPKIEFESIPRLVDYLLVAVPGIPWDDNGQIQGCQGVSSARNWYYTVRISTALHHSMDSSVTETRIRNTWTESKTQFDDRSNFLGSVELQGMN